MNALTDQDKGSMETQSQTAAKPAEHRETFLPPPQTRREAPGTVVRPVTTPMPQTSTVHFIVHPAMFEIIGYANDRGWLASGWTSVSIQWQELHWTTDNWQTVQVLKSTDAVPK